MTEQAISKAISVRAPWWWFILHAGKDIENRTWPTNFRGTVYLHASKWWSKPSVIDDANTALDCYRQTESVSKDEMTWDTMKRYGDLPTPSGASLDIGEKSISAFRREVASLNREFAADRLVHAASEHRSEPNV